MTKRHVHADVIHAWAEGEDVEWRDPSSEKWEPTAPPTRMWREDYEYRIKPKEPKRLANENFIAMFMEYACANLDDQKKYQDGWFTSEMEIALDVAGSFYAWLEKQHE